MNFAGLTGQIRDSSRMKAKRIKPDSEPILVREGSVSVKIYTTTNRIYRVNPANGQRELKSEHPQFCGRNVSWSRLERIMASG